jgi:cytochrome P450
MSGIAPIIDFESKDYDPFLLDAAAYGDIEDIHSRLAVLRERAPVHKGDLLTLLGWSIDPNVSAAALPQFTVFGYEEVLKVDGDSDTYSIDAYENGLGLTFGRTLSLLNPPEHTKIRRVFQKAFLPNIVSKWGDDLVSPVVNGLIDKFADRGHADLAEEFAVKYPFQIIFRQLALPQRDIAVFHKLAVSMTQLYGDMIRYGQEASRKLGTYFADMIEERRKTPGDDLVSLLIHAEVDGERIPDETIISFLRQLINAAGDTTYRATGTLLIALLNRPQLLERVREDRSLIAPAIEETMRWDGPVTVHMRMATRDTRLGGLEVPKGAVLNVCLPAANRDPKVFSDPDRFDIDRKKVRHVGFGFGNHVCVGQHLARLEMTRALNAIFDRLPNLRLDPARPRPTVLGAYMRTPHDINVLFG